MDIVHPDIEGYLMRLLPPRDEVLLKMEKLAKEKNFPIVGPLVGRLLCQMAKVIGARRVFEFGSGFGYSAYWFSKGMEGQGRVILTDDDAENARMARDFFQRAGLEASMELEVGDAFEIFDRKTGMFDIVFLDCEKERYPEAFDRALPRIRQGGLLIADNLLWFGRVIKRSPEPSVIGIQKFGQLIMTSPQLLTTIVPLRDGVSISLKL
jgi:predicted O-methyltransferase YrrM